MRLKHALLGLIVSIVGLPLLGTPGYADDRLQGAWATSAAGCDQVFTRRNGRLVLNKSSAEGWSGFIVTGKHIRGARATCDLINAKQKGDVTTFLLGCEDDIAFDTMSVSVRFVGGDKLVRFDPEFPEVETTYNRCDR